MTFSSKKWYEGEWANGKQEGEGTMFSPDSSVLQQGYWREGKYDGTTRKEEEP